MSVQLGAMAVRITSAASSNSNPSSSHVAKCIQICIFCAVGERKRNKDITNASAAPMAIRSAAAPSTIVAAMPQNDFSNSSIATSLHPSLAATSEQNFGQDKLQPKIIRPARVRSFRYRQGYRIAQKYH